MIKIHKIVALMSLGFVLLTSCNKDKNDWNLNPAPSITLDSVIITTPDGKESYKLTGEQAASDIIVPSTGAKLELSYSFSSLNGISQISFHDGTESSSNMYLLTSKGDTIKATPPASKYRPVGDKVINENVKIVFKSVSTDMILSMIVNDKEVMSTSHAVKVKGNSVDIDQMEVETNEVILTGTGKLDTLLYGAKKYNTLAFKDSANVVKLVHSNPQESLSYHTLDKMASSDFMLSYITLYGEFDAVSPELKNEDMQIVKIADGKFAYFKVLDIKTDNGVRTIKYVLKPFNATR